MTKILSALAAFVPVILSGAAFAQSVTEIRGDVRLNGGTGFVQVKVSRSVAVGDRVMARPKGSAVIQYSNGCRVRVAPGEIVTVLASPPCVAGGPPFPTRLMLSASIRPMRLSAGLLLLSAVLCC